MEDKIKEYILKYRDSYSKEQIVSQLKNSGLDDKEINRIYSSLNNESNNQNKIKKGKVKLGLFLIIIGLIIPLLGYILIISGIVLGFKHKKISKDGLSIFVIIFGFISLILGFFTQTVIFGIIMLSFVDFGSLIPSSIDLDNNNIRGDPMFSYFEGNSLNIVFDNVGYSKLIIDGSKSIVTDSDGNSCNFESLRNEITKEEGNQINFSNEESGIIIFNCNDFDRGSFFDKKDNFQGTLKISIINPNTQEESISEGSIRLTIKE